MLAFILFWQEAGGGISSVIWSFLPFLFIIAIFYFLVIQPQRRRQQEVQNMISTLKVGDMVITNGGIVGKIIELRERSLIVRSADKSNLEITRSAVVAKDIEG